MKTKKKKLRSWLVALVCFFVMLPVAWVLVVKLEGEKPSVMLELPSQSIGKLQSISVVVSDAKSGVRSIWIGLIKDRKETVLIQKDFKDAGLLAGGEIHEASYKIDIEPKKMGISDGKAILRIVARDFSWRGLWHGNKTYIEKIVEIDNRPPDVDILTRFHNVSQGGSGLVIYKLSESCSKSGVYVGENFFPGHSGNFKDSKILMAFFALSFKQGTGTEIFVKATDFAGNSARAGLPHHFKKRIFKNDLIEISDRFLNRKMPEFDVEISQGSKASLIDKFLKVNREFRQDGYMEIVELAEKIEKDIYWDGAFLRLPKSERSAGFADHRKYNYKGRVIDRQVHLGVDLASVAQSPVPASNKGKIVFAGGLGIYGKTVIIDHGFGLFSTYSHLSRYDVNEGQMVSKGEIIGRTGSTGLAGGDHLHFGMFVHNTFVNPVEWWDADWINNNISDKIDAVKSINP